MTDKHQERGMTDYAREDDAYRDADGNIDPFAFALKKTRPATNAQFEAAFGPGQPSGEENNCEQEEGA